MEELGFGDLFDDLHEEDPENVIDLGKEDEELKVHPEAT